MINELKLINFRNFKEKKLANFSIENFIVGENGRGKTNILEALARLSNNTMGKLSLDDLIIGGEDYFYIEIKDNKNSFSFFYSKEGKKKSFMINNKKTTQKKFFENSYVSVVFSPLHMNLFYLSPSLRRDFIDNVLKSTYTEYDKLLTEYKKILKSRNSLLKAINEKKASKNEIEFWNNKFIEKSKQIYEYRLCFIEFIENSISNTKEYFLNKPKKINFNYITKINKNNIELSIKDYLEKNIERDLILQKTHIGPHIDDFEILIDGKNIIELASRGEIKSVVIYLKLLEGFFLEKMTGKKPIMIIDDLLSELDETHKTMLLKKIKYYQSFISSITIINEKPYIKI